MGAAPLPIRSGLTRASRAVVVDVDSGAEHEVGVEQASVVIDRAADARRQVDATITPDVDPLLLAAPHRLRLWLGYRDGGTEHLTQVCDVRLGERTRGPRSLWRVSSCLSAEAQVAAARLRAPRVLAPGSSQVAAMVSLITEAVPGAQVRVETARDALVPPSGVTVERERWAAVAGQAESIATSLGIDVGVDGAGTFVLRDADAVGDTWDTTEFGTVFDYTERTDPTSVVNVWVCHSDRPEGEPVRGIAADEDPYSPTRTSRWGEVVRFHASPYYEHSWQCEQAARARLATSRGERVSLDLTVAPNPWLDLPDLVTAVGVDGIHTVALDRIELGWSASDAMRLTAAGRSVAVRA